MNCFISPHFPNCRFFSPKSLCYKLLLLHTAHEPVTRVTDRHLLKKKKKKVFPNSNQDNSDKLDRHSSPRPSVPSFPSFGVATFGLKAINKINSSSESVAEHAMDTQPERTTTSKSNPGALINWSFLRERIGIFRFTHRIYVFEVDLVDEVSFGLNFQCGAWSGYCILWIQLEILSKQWKHRFET